MGPFALFKLQPMIALLALLLLSCTQDKPKTAAKKPEAATDDCKAGASCLPDQGPIKSEVITETEASLAAFYSCREIRIEGTAGQPLAARADSQRSAEKIADLLEEAQYQVLAWNKDGETLQHDLVPLRSSSLWYQIAVGGQDAWVSAVYTRCLDSTLE